MNEADSLAGPAIGEFQDRMELVSQLQIQCRVQQTEPFVQNQEVRDYLRRPVELADPSL